MHCPGSFADCVPAVDSSARMRQPVIIRCFPTTITMYGNSDIVLPVVLLLTSVSHKLKE